MILLKIQTFKGARMTDSSLLFLLFPLALGYLLGSIPFGLLWIKLTENGDIRKTGSGNIGATNVLRSGRTDLALLTLICDAGKAGLAAFFSGLIWGEKAAFIAAGASFIGHCYPCWLKFRGGKGVACFLGLLLVLDWRVGLASGFFWILIAFLTRYSSLASLASVLFASIMALLLKNFLLAYLSSTLSILVFWLHRENIRRLTQNTESKISLKKTKNKK